MTEKEFIAVKSNYHDMILFIKEELNKKKVKNKIIKKVHIITEEIITNIINYAYIHDLTKNSDCKKYVKIAINLNSENELKLLFTDAGIHYDFNGINNGPMKEPKIGGLGIFFIKTLADSTDFKRINGENMLEVVIQNVNI
jgi:anti-sigma regulatory factor (Ser/Thr protein kinase)